MKATEQIHRQWARIKRCRHRRGFGVHSPFAFSLITDVIYEKGLYYAYAEIEQKWPKESKVRRLPLLLKKHGELLFRLVNRVQPTCACMWGGHPVLREYVQAAKPHTMELHEVHSIAGMDSVIKTSPIHFLYLDCAADASSLWSIFDGAANAVTSQSLFVVQGIYASKQMTACWERIKEDNRVGITFDLYDMGLLFFDRSKLKQHYIVNF